MIEPLRIFIGFDEREAVAYHVCCQSIIARATRPVSITPLAARAFTPDYIDKHGDGSNAFTYTRFLVPWLCNYMGLALYLDGDMIVQTDLAELFSNRPLYDAVRVVKHDYKTKHPVKYLGARNEDYERKNWSSVILWNCSSSRNRCLTPDFVLDKPGAFLHRFGWLADDRIGELPPEWNHLTMEYDPNDQAKILHFTVGTPCFAGYEQQEGADEWRAEYAAAIHPMKAA